MIKTQIIQNASTCHIQVINYIFIIFIRFRFFLSFLLSLYRNYCVLFALCINNIKYESDFFFLCLPFLSFKVYEVSDFSQIPPFPPNQKKIYFLSDPPFSECFHTTDSGKDLCTLYPIVQYMCLTLSIVSDTHLDTALESTCKAGLEHGTVYSSMV